MGSIRVFLSSTRTERDPATVAAILRTSRTNNRRDGITSASVFDDSQFAQVLEGEPGTVTRCLARMRRDPRHADMTILNGVPAPHALFPLAGMVGIEADVIAEALPGGRFQPKDMRREELQEIFHRLAWGRPPGVAPAAPADVEPDSLAEKLAILRRIHWAARQVLDGAGRDRPLDAATLERLRQSVTSQARHALDLQAMAQSDGSSPLALCEEVIREAVALHAYLETVAVEIDDRLRRLRA